MTSTPRILVISNYNGPINPIRAEAEIFLGLKAKGHFIVVMSPEGGEYGKKIEDAGIETINVKPTSKYDRKAIKAIKAAVDKYDINIIHAFNSKAIANAAWAVWRNPSVKLVSYRGYTGNISRFDPTNYLSFLNSRIDFMVCLAESVRQVYLRNGIDPNKAITINKGHSSEWYDKTPPADLSEFNFPNDAVIIAFVANHRTKMKGVKYLVEAIDGMDPALIAYVLMIGEGLETEEVKRWIKEKSLTQRFVFTGFRKDASSLVKSSDVSVSASLFGEATQKAVIEAMYLGNPVVITDIAGNVGMVEDGKSGFVVPAADSAELKSALEKLVSNESLRQKLGQAGRKHISEFLSIDRSVNEYEAFYRRILD